MEKIWHKKKNTRILLIIIAKVMVISMMLGVMSIISYAELFDDLKQENLRRAMKTPMTLIQSL